MVDIYLIRHTNVEVDASVCYGQTDVGLAPNYQEEFEALKAKLPEFNNAVCFSSPLIRCKLLAEFLAGPNCVYDERIKEIFLGDWEMKSWEYVQANLFMNWKGDFVYNKSPNGESYMDLYKRSIEFYEEVINNTNLDVVIITHMGVIRAIITHVLGMQVSKAFNMKLEYGGISKIEILPVKTQLLYFNR
ncbi:MAG: alpha-ribazole phosphatase family protein [Cyanobacteriota bacterium]